MCVEIFLPASSEGIYPRIRPNICARPTVLSKLERIRVRSVPLLEDADKFML